MSILYTVVTHSPIPEVCLCYQGRIDETEIRQKGDPFPDLRIVIHEAGDTSFDAEPGRLPGYCLKWAEDVLRAGNAAITGLVEAYRVESPGDTVAVKTVPE